VYEVAPRCSKGVNIRIKSVYKLSALSGESEVAAGERA